MGLECSSHPGLRSQAKTKLPRTKGMSPMLALLRSGGILEHSPDTGPREGRDGTPETDQEINLANQYLPSAMGISALVDLPERLLVEVAAATYQQGDAHKPERGQAGRKPWLRQPLSEIIELQC